MGQSSVTMSSDLSKTILIAQYRAWQADLWQLVFESQGHHVLLEQPRAELIEVITARNPDLVIVDMSTGTFNPYALCRSCRAESPGLPVILTHPPDRKIDPAEHRWATYQGAADVLPYLIQDPETIANTLASICQLAGWSTPLDRPSLDLCLTQIGIFPEAPGSQPMDLVPLEPVELNTNGSALVSSNGSSSNHKAQSAPAKVKHQILYRGRVVGKS